MGLTIRLNGTEETLERATVDELLRARGIDPPARGIAVALNDAVVPARRLARDARSRRATLIEIVRPFSGG